MGVKDVPAPASMRQPVLDSVAVAAAAPLAAAGGPPLAPENTACKAGRAGRPRKPGPLESASASDLAPVSHSRRCRQANVSSIK